MADVPPYCVAVSGIGHTANIPTFRGAGAVALCQVKFSGVACSSAAKSQTATDTFWANRKERN